MISDRQLDANRRNAQLSTGPQTPEGRAAVRNNAVTHGLTAQYVVLPKENKEEFEDLFASFEAEYQPDGPTENLLLKQVVINAWRLQRLQGMETAFFGLASVDRRKYFAEQYRNTDAHDLHAYIFREDAGNDDVLSRLARYESRIQRSFYKALHELQRLRTLRNAQTPPQPHPDDSETAPSDSTPPILAPPNDPEKSNPFPKPDTTIPTPNPNSLHTIPNSEPPLAPTSTPPGQSAIPIAHDPAAAGGVPVIPLPERMP